MGGAVLPAMLKPTVRSSDGGSLQGSALASALNMVSFKGRGEREGAAFQQQQESVNHPAGAKIKQGDKREA